MVYQLLQKFTVSIFPPTCVLCGEHGATGRDLCAPCAARLPFITICCYRCGIPLADSRPDQADTLCGRCLKRLPHFDLLFSPLRYEQPVDWLVQQLKFHARFSHIRVLGGLLGDYLERQLTEPPHVIVPVPLHANRLRERGFNQAHELAKIVASRFSIPLLSQICLRHVDTPQQSSLPAKQRAKNLRRAFSISRKPAATRIAIVDDVVTTGATVNALAGLLKQFGVQHVQVWSVARTVSMQKA